MCVRDADKPGLFMMAFASVIDRYLSRHNVEEKKENKI